MAENANKPEKAVPCCSAVEHPKLISLSEERRNLISVANKVFGEGKWSHTVVKQTLDFDDVDSDEVDSDDEYFDDEINARNKYRTKCVSYIKIQLENGNFCEGDGFYIADESTKGLSIQIARIGSVVNVLKRVLLSFGDKIERELQQLQRQISSGQVNTFVAAEPIDLAINFHDLISVANKVFGESKWNHTVVHQTLDFNDADFDDVDPDDVIYRAISARDKYCAGCVSYVKIQLENGNFHEDIGYINADEGLSIQTVRIGSAINGLFRVLLSFGDKVERELKQLRRQIGSEQVNTFTAAEQMDLAINFHHLISVANKVFGEGKWNHTVVRQILDFDVIDGEINARNKYCAGCVSYVKIQLENGNFHEDVGYFNADESTRSLSIHSARIGSAINALFRVLLSFGDKVEKDLKQLRRQIGSEQVNTFTAAEPMDLAINFYDLISMANKVFGEGKWNHTVVSQTLEFIDTDDINYAAIDAQDKYRNGCISFVKVQLENGNFHEDVGYFNAEEPTRGLSIYNARIGSAVNALKRVLLSFGDKVETELQQLRRQISSNQEPMDLAADFPDLIFVANKVFGEGKWNHTVISQTLDFDNDINYAAINAPCIYCAGCVSFVKIQLENENFHEDIGYYNAEESIKDLALQNARIGSAVNALKRVLLSFGDKVKRELQQLRREISSEQVNTFATAESTDLAADFPDLISAANKVFGEGKWNHTVVSQTLEFNYDRNYGAINARGKYRVGCVSSVKVQLENGNFHKDVGYFNAEEPTRSLSIYSARIGSAVNALKRVLLSFGDKVERELQQLRRQISSDQELTDLAADFPDLISAANKIFGEGKWNHTVISQTLDVDCENYATSNAPHVYHTGCVSFVKVQLENGNFHEDIGYFNAEEPTRNLSTYNARIGSAVNALRRVLLSFGEKIGKELQRQVIPKQVSDIKRNATQSLEPMDLIAELPDLISAANKVFGEGNWRHTVVKQILAKKYGVRGIEYYADCVSYVKVQLKNEIFHVDVGYCSTKEPTRGLAILNAKIGSAVNALKRVLMSFGEQFERELQQLQKQISPEQTDDV